MALNGSDQDPKQVQAAGDLILNSIKRRTYRRGQQPSGGWLHSPATLQLFAATHQRLVELAEAMKVDLGGEKKVTMIRAARRQGETRVWIYPTAWNDPEGIALKAQSGKLQANLYDFMAEANWLVEMGHSERYALQDAKPEDPTGENALWFDLKKPVERKLNTKGRAAAKTQAEKAEAKLRAEAAAKLRAEVAAKALAEAEAKVRAELEAKARAEAEAALRAGAAAASDTKAE